jgi:hypothetical protein
MNKTRKYCVYDFVFEIAFGLLFIVSILINKPPFGFSLDFPVMTGLGIFLYLFIHKRTFDERDYFLYYRTNHFTLGSMIIIIMISKFCLSNLINTYWASFIISAFFFFHGSIGLIFFLYMGSEKK